MIDDGVGVGKWGYGCVEGVRKEREVVDLKSSVVR